MAAGAPDWVRMVQVVVNVANAPVVPVPEHMRAAGGAGKYSGSSTSYQTVVSWTVAAGMIGELKQIMVISDNYAKTKAQVTVGSITWATDWAPTATLPLIFESLKLAAATLVTVEVASTDGTAIEADAAIVGLEIF